MEEADSRLLLKSGIIYHMLETIIIGVYLRPIMHGMTLNLTTDHLLDVPNIVVEKTCLPNLVV